MGAEQHPAYPEELGRLHRTVGQIREQLRRRRGASAFTREGEDLGEESMHAIHEAEAALESRRLLSVRRLRLASQEPYFGRVDFQPEGEAEPEVYYIGKVAVEESGTGAPLVIDWRAPVSSLFYTGTGPDDTAAYLAPGGTISGTLALKRHLLVRRGVLRHIGDSHQRGGGDGTVGDAYLLYALQESRDSRLRDIVATIRADQDAIIRAPRDRALVIQGAAGSGKTSVALHRLAYLLYAQRGALAPERILILAPNRMFLDYIADVLPELGVGGVRQTTFADWALEQLRHRVTLGEPGPRLEREFAPGARGQSCEEAGGGVPGSGAGVPGSGAGAPGGGAGGADPVIARTRGALAFRAELDRAVAAYAAACVPDADLELWPGARLDRGEVYGWFHQAYSHYPLNRRRRRVLTRVKRWARRQAEANPGQDERAQRYRALVAVRRWSALWPRHTALSLYRRVLGQVDGGRQVEPADLAALVYLQARLDGLAEPRPLDHVVVDEAQDFSPLQVEVLREITRDNSFTILGDLAQGIHAVGISGWAELTDLFPAGQASYHELPVSYRSSHPIICLAGHVLAAAGTAPPVQPVVRPGPPVRVGRRQPGALRDPLVAEVRRLQARQHASIAVVGRTAAECAALWAELAAVGLKPRRITADQDRYRGGLSVIPCYLAKGLEFDAVVVADAGADAYGQAPLDARLLYVVLTRALHELTVFWVGAPSPLLRDMPPDLVEPCGP